MQYDLHIYENSELFIYNYSSNDPVFQGHVDSKEDIERLIATLKKMAEDLK